MIQEIAFQIAKRRAPVLAGVSALEGSSYSTVEKYDEWRHEELETEFLKFFGADMIAGKDVLDFGCGDGDLALILNSLGAKSCIGVDIDARSIAVAKNKVRGEPVSFICASNTTGIDLDDASVDVIACFDVMEHVMEYEAIMKEWLRVLRPGGKVLIHWQPWFHPYGHHGRNYIPIPWVHLFLNYRKRTEVCARIAELPDFNPAWQDKDEDEQRTNRFRQSLESGSVEDDEFLNRLTLWRFEHLCGETGLKIERRVYVNFQGPFVVRIFCQLVSYIPFVREFFTANAIYVLTK
ncbi:MAG: class I SAM-dependent methyltransferase [Gammaproteobacteria bacterium]|nr:class I SAM-dependent methyltransferase [Gammaproteobacteria bacterium]MDP6616542.1 class I SAM-dependent methyltransferase [Gammaproteobacteria bacterium]MDP6694209.1 class I SAM-dependent methyltransferase [Gammaproteobacteria bacterium]MDP7041341.1 class I SAM-dependent methyltransferase [Gammaproteobacteria bacterium]